MLVRSELHVWLSRDGSCSWRFKKLLPTQWLFKNFKILETYVTSVEIHACLNFQTIFPFQESMFPDTNVYMILHSLWSKTRFHQRESRRSSRNQGVKGYFMFWSWTAPGRWRLESSTNVSEEFNCKARDTREWALQRYPQELSCHTEKEGPRRTQGLLGTGASCVRSSDECVHLGKVYERLGGFWNQRTTTQLITGPTEPPFLSFLVILPRGQRGARSCPNSGVGGGKKNLSIQRVKAQENKIGMLRCRHRSQGCGRNFGNTEADQGGKRLRRDGCQWLWAVTLPGNWPALYTVKSSTHPLRSFLLRCRINGDVINSGWKLKVPGEAPMTCFKHCPESLQATTSCQPLFSGIKLPGFMSHTENSLLPLCGILIAVFMFL